MRKWKYNLKAGLKLRALIHAEDMEEEDQQVAILNQLKVCYEELLKQEKTFDEYERDDFEDALNLLDGDDELVHLYYAHDAEWFNYGFDSAEDLVNERLGEFYDLCDAYSIWVEL